MAWLPLASIVLMVSLFWPRAPHDLPIVVYDADGSALSRQLLRSIDATPSLRIRSWATSLDEGRDSVLRGDAYALLAIPAGYQRDVLRGAPHPSQLFYNAQLLTAGNLAARDARMAAATLSASRAVGRRVLGGEATPLAIRAANPIATQLHALFNPGLDYSRFLGLAVIAALLHIFAVIAGVDSTARELRERTAEDWLATAGGSPAAALAGKLALHWLWFSALGAVAIFGNLALLGVVVAGSALLLLLGWIAFVAASLALGALLTLLTADLRLATSVSSLLISPALAFSGLTFPAVAFPVAVAGWSALLPLTHYLQLQTQQVSMATTGWAALAPVVALLAFVMPPLLGLPRWRRLLSQPPLRDEP